MLFAFKAGGLPGLVLGMPYMVSKQTLKPNCLLKKGTGFSQSTEKLFLQCSIFQKAGGMEILLRGREPAVVALNNTCWISHLQISFPDCMAARLRCLVHLAHLTQGLLTDATYSEKDLRQLRAALGCVWFQRNRSWRTRIILWLPGSLQGPCEQVSKVFFMEKDQVEEVTYDVSPFWFIICPRRVVGGLDKW